jgi:anti-sigma factor RsiW
MDHDRATELFSALWDGELAREESAALRDHLGTCLACRRDFENFEKSMGALKSLQRVLAPPDFAVGVQARIRRRSMGRFFTPQRLSERVPYELFSLVMLGLIVAIYVVFGLSHPQQLRLP